uniref:Retroelement n=1 Tax=Oryza sativa subsp. japonica TaxID=39947 RepID=Q8S659_ORYSJ|nr:Putative retroelement [Oryza sativa Japonica Group]
MAIVLILIGGVKFSDFARMRKKLPMHERLGPIHQDYFEEKAEDKPRVRNPQCCPYGIFTKNKKRRVQRMRNREQMQEIEEEIDNRLKRTKEWWVKSKVVPADEKGVPYKLYLSTDEKTIGSVLIREIEGKERAIFYLSRRLLDAETRLRHYLLSNECTVVCKADVVRYMLTAPVLKRRIGKWILDLTEFDLRYESTKAVKGQTVADFIVEYRNDSLGYVE